MTASCVEHGGAVAYERAIADEAKNNGQGAKSNQETVINAAKECQEYAGEIARKTNTFFGARFDVDGAITGGMTASCMEHGGLAPYKKAITGKAKTF